MDCHILFSVLRHTLVCCVLAFVEDSTGGKNMEMRIYDHWKNTKYASLFDFLLFGASVLRSKEAHGFHQHECRWIALIQ